MGELSECLLAYFAGFVDGEGSITIELTRVGENKTLTIRLRVTIGNTCLEVLELIQKYYGGSIVIRKPNAGKKQWWEWKVTSKRAVRFLEDIKPFLIVKRPQHELALEFYYRFLGDGKSNYVTQDEFKQRLEYVGRIRKLNSNCGNKNYYMRKTPYEWQNKPA